MSNLNFFDDNQKKSKSSKKENIKIRLDDHYFDKIKELEEVNNRIKFDKRVSESITEDVKEVGKEKWIQTYLEIGANPGTLTLQAFSDDSVAEAIFVPSDKYISINKEKADILISKYGDDIIEEETFYKIDSDMANRYGQIISDLIMNCDDIPDLDKENIIKSVTNYSIKKGSINCLDDFGQVDEVLENIKPIFSLKSIEIVKS